ncbi:PucR family transcriptional regulator [Saccharopolyspora sp. 5N102]|uniref:PucR family transcriptional regulator n=1 Tax=Saccharopolyspora sp. 5N102 TaxID=3375155 RepID=UPI0037A5C559
MRILPDDGPLRLADLLAEARLGLRLLTAADTGPARQIDGAHAIEIANPSRWVPPHWLLLTTGMRIQRKPTEQRALVRELAGSNIAALGYATGIVTRRVPTALLDEADRLGFPVIEVPLETPHRDVIGFVQQQVLGSSPELLQRVLQTQAYLMGVEEDDPLAHAEAPEIALLRRLQPLVGTEVILLRTDGRPNWPEDHLHARELREALHAQPANGPAEVGVDDLRYLALPVRTGPYMFGWLVREARAGDGAQLLPVLRSAAQLLGVMYVAREHEPAELRAQRRHLLESALFDGATADGGGDLDRRARIVGFDFSSDCRVLVYRPAGNRCALGRVEAALNAARMPFLATAHGADVVVFAQGERETLVGSVESLPPGRVGSGRAVRSLGRAKESLADAEFVLGRMTAVPGKLTAADFSDLSLANWLIARLPSTEIAEKSGDFLAGLREQPLLFETVVAYLGADLDTTATAEALHLHPNSVRYRLTRAEHVLGAPLRRPETIAGLHAALLSEGLL